MRLRLWPRSLAARTALVLLAGPGRGAGRGPDHPRARPDRRAAPGAGARYRGARGQHLSHRDDDAARAPRATVLAELHRLPGLTAELVADAAGRRSCRRCAAVRAAAAAGRTSTWCRCWACRTGASCASCGARTGTASSSAMRLPDGDWLNLSVPIEPPRPWHSPTFLVAFLLMTVDRRRADALGGAAADRAGAHARRRGRGAGPRRERAAAAGGRPDRRSPPPPRRSTPWPRASAASSTTAPSC